METEAEIGIVSTQELSPQSQEDKFQNTISFLKAAIAEGAHLKIPLFMVGGKSIRNISEEAWARQKNIVGVYFGSPATEQELGDIYGGVTREWIRSIKDRGVRNLWKNCSSETQTLFPFEELVLRKTSKNLELENKLRNAKTDQEKQTLLNQVKHRFYHKHIGGENPLLISIEDVMKEARLSKGWQARNFVMFYDSLKSVNFPMYEIPVKSESKTGEERIVAYHFALTEDKERAKQILLADPNLQRFRRS